MASTDGQPDKEAREPGTLAPLLPWILMKARIAVFSTAMTSTAL
jgi:hypothetical protein